MTREEITEVNKILDFAKEVNGIAYKALKEVLEQESCADAISRQAAIDELCKMLHDCFGADDEELDAVITTLNELQPITPTEKVGQWIYDKIRYWNGGCKYECSECGMGSDVDYAYCMRCGCKMQEVEE